MALSGGPEQLHRAGFPRLAGYEVEALIGHGPSGPVYLGRATRAGDADGRDADGRDARVAIKLLACWDDSRLRDELVALAEIARSVRHPNVVATQDLVGPEGEMTMALVTAFAPAGSLVARIGATTGSSPPTDASIEWLAAIAEGLHAAHVKGLLHSNIHPAAVLFSAAGDPMLSDFGVARVMAGPGWTGGAAEYLDPALAGKGEPSVSSDIYALGVLGRQLLTGKVPYEGETPSATVRRAARGKALALGKVLPDLPRSLCDALDAAMAREPGSRPSSA
ncbi:MAG: serine/threonine-protein kinase, partial [Thermoplasmata archaeon]